MIKLEKVLQALGTPDFNSVLKREIARLGAEHLPLQQGLSRSSTVVDAPVTVLVNSVVELDGAIRVKVGIFYKGVLGGCSCAGDPTEIGENDEYCEVQLDIDKTTAATTVTLATE